MATKKKIATKKRVGAKTNTYGANQYLYDPRQELFWGYYTNPNSETFSNAYQSAVRAKYENNSATQITKTEWFNERLRRMNLFQKAEKVLEETIEMETFTPVIGQYGPVYVEGDEIDANGIRSKKLLFGQNDKLLKIKQDSAKFVAERLGKKRGYSTRTEVTGEDGKPLPTPIYGGINTIHGAEPTDSK